MNDNHMNTKIILLVSLSYYKIKKTIVQIRDIIDSIKNLTKI